MFWLLSWLCKNVHDVQGKRLHWAFSVGGASLWRMRSPSLTLPASLQSTEEPLKPPSPFCWWVTAAISHTKNTLKETALTTALSAALAVLIPLTLDHQPLPPLACHGRIRTIMQFTPSNPTNLWAGYHCGSKWDWQRKKKGKNWREWKLDCVMSKHIRPSWKCAE